MSRKLSATIGATICLVASLAMQPANAAPKCEERPHGNPNCIHYHESDFESDIVTLAEDALPLDATWGDSNSAGMAAAANPTCNYPGTRVTTDGNDTERRLVIVYLVGSTGTDYHLDQPRVCSDGTVHKSPIHNSYFNMAVSMSKELEINHGHGHRWRPQTHTYGTGLNAKSIVDGGFVRDMNYTTTDYNNFSISGKLIAGREALINAGFDNPNHVYMMICECRQPGMSVGGTAWFDQADDAPGDCGTGWNHFCFGLALRFFYNSNTGQNYSTKYGCSNYAGDAVAMHELTHIMGAVPTSAPNYHTSDDNHHIFVNNDLMEKQIDQNLSDGNGNALADFDKGTNDYRAAVLNNGWDIDGTSTSFRTC